MVSTYIFPGNSHNFALDSRRISLSGSGGDFCECTMVFAFVQTTEKTAFLGLKQSGFTQSGLLTTVQIFVHFVQFVQILFAKSWGAFVLRFLRESLYLQP